MPNEFKTFTVQESGWSNPGKSPLGDGKGGRAGSHLHQITEALLTEDVPQEAHLLPVVGVRPELRGQKCQGLMQT